MTTTDELRATLAEVLADIAPDADLMLVDHDAPLNDQVDLDSMDMLTLMERLGTRAGITIPDRDAPRLQTVNGIVGYLCERLEV